MTKRFLPSNPWSGPLWSALALMGVAFLLAFGFRDAIARFPRGLLTDDAYFYAKLALNLARDHLSSFDGVHPTDGYHLLWTYLLATVSWVTSFVSQGSGVHLSAMIAFYLLLAGFIALRFGRTPAQMALLFLLSMIFKMLMETTLLALLLMTLSHEVHWRATRAQPRVRVLVLVAFLVPLVRIDALFLPMLLALGAWPARDDRRSGLWVVLGSLLGGGAELMANHAICGHWISVAARIKSADFLEVGGNLAANLTGLYGGGGISFFVFAVATVFVFLRVRGARSREQRWSGYAVLGTATLFVLEHLLFNRCMRYWYYVPGLYLLLQAVIETRDGASNRPLMFRAVAVTLLVGLLSKFALDTHLRAREIAYSHAFVAQVKDWVPENAGVFQIDGTGFVGYFSDRHIINGDGLVNSHEFADRLRDNKLAGYLAETGTRYIIHSSYPTGDLLMSHHGLVIRLSEVEVLVSPPPGLARHTAFGLYKLLNDDG